MRRSLTRWFLVLLLAFGLFGCRQSAAPVAESSRQNSQPAEEEIAVTEASPHSDPVASEDLRADAAPRDEAVKELESAASPAEPAAPHSPLAASPSPRGQEYRHFEMAKANAATRGRGLGDRVAKAKPGAGAIPVDPLADHDGLAAVEGRGPGASGDKFDRIYENDFKEVKSEPLSTFSIDVDTASYSRVRSYLMEYNQLPPADSVRIEELVNYFPYDYVAPMSEHPFSALMEVTQCPWQPEHRLARIAVKGQEIQQDERPASNLVFLLDVSGSMNDANKLPLVKKGMQLLTSQLNKNDRVAIVVYAGAAGLVLPSTTGDQHKAISDALEALESGGSTNGGEGINLAYKTAEENFITAGTNRVILCSDGDFNVGVTSTAELVRLAEEFAKKNIFLSVLGFGTGNLNDSLMEQLATKANGNHAFIDTENEAKKVLVEQMAGTLVTIAKDVKIQVEFNPTKVKAYRLIGYENRMLAAEDFNNDKKDAGEIGAGHTVTALYEIVPSEAETKLETGKIDELKYQKDRQLTGAAESDELLTLKLRYKQPEGDKSTLLSFPIDDATEKFGAATPDFKFAAAVASFGMLLRDSAHKGDTSYDAVLEIAADGAKGDMTGYRTEFLELVKKAKELAKK